LILLLAWVAWCVIYPTWVGSFYSADGGKPGVWYPGGTFGLKGTQGLGKVAPIWDPPIAHADDVIKAVVRYPWQPITAHEHVEIAMDKFIITTCWGVIALGMLLGFVSRLTSPANPDPFAVVVFWISCGLLLALVACYVIAGLSMGYGPDEESFFWIMISGLVLGITVAVYRLIRRRARPHPVVFSTSPKEPSP